MRLNISPNAKFASDFVQRVIRLTRPAGIKNFDIEIKGSQAAYAGACYHDGSGYHGSASPFIVARVGDDKHFPHRCHYNKIESAPTYWIYDRREMLVVLVAHELRHLWQHKQKNRRGYCPRTRGKYSEVDCEAYALRMLRKYRAGI